MSSVLNYENYREYLTDRLARTGRRGQLGQLAKGIGVPPSLVTEVLKGLKQLTSQQAFATTRYLGLSANETKHFLLLVEISRASEPRYRRYLLQEMVRAKLKLKKKQAASKDHSLAEVYASKKWDRYYSTWYFSAIHMLTAIDSFQDIDSLAVRLDLPRQTVADVLDQLVKSGLCKQEGNRFKIENRKLFAHDIQSYRDQINQQWRLRAFSRLHHGKSKDLFCSHQLTLSEEDAKKVREKVQGILEDLELTVDRTTPENGYCFNIDWFEI